MQKTALTLTTTALALAALGCEPKTKTKVVTNTVTVEVPAKEKTYDYQKESTGLPLTVPAFDKNCSDKTGLSLGNTGIIGDVYTGVDLVQTTTTIEEDIFAKATEISRETVEFSVINGGYEIALCRDSAVVPSDSLEGAAIHMKAAAESAYTHYQTVKSNSSLPLPVLGPVDLNAVMKIKMVERKISKDGKATEKTVYRTDNASFSGGETPTLVSYPLSETAKKYNIFGGTPLWNVSGVFQHEFGHYIFGSIMQSGSADAFASYFDYVKKNPDLHLFHQPRADLAKTISRPDLRTPFEGFIATQDFFLGSLNEGFADLWAYYTLEQKPEIFDILCFTKNRTVGSALFYNGQSKSWDTTTWDSIFSADLDEIDQRQYPTPLAACSDPIFVDVHIVGAAMAHTADAVFTAAAKASGNTSAITSSRLKAEMALTWLQKLKGSDEFQDLGSKASLSRILNTAVGTAIQYLKGADRTELCATVKTKFPVPVSRWKNSKTDNEDVSGAVDFCAL